MMWPVPGWLSFFTESCDNMCILEGTYTSNCKASSHTLFALIKTHWKETHGRLKLVLLILIVSWPQLLTLAACWLCVFPGADWCQPLLTSRAAMFSSLEIADLGQSLFLCPPSMLQWAFKTHSLPKRQAGRQVVTGSLKSTLRFTANWRPDLPSSLTLPNPSHTSLSLLL